MMVGACIFSLMLSPLSGCKKQEPPPPPPQKAMPLPQKPVQKNISAAKQNPANPGAQAGQQVAANQPQTAAVQTAVKPGIQKQISSAKPLLPLGAISLDFTNRRDPFKPFVQAPQPQATAGKSGGRVKDPLPIQSFDTEKFRVSGIISGIRENSALVLDPNGKGYVVREGMLLGNNDGRIKRISASTVEVEENFKDDNGKVRKRLVKLTLIRKK